MRILRFRNYFACVFTVAVFSFPLTGKSEDDGVQDIAKKIDTILEQRWKKEEVVPAQMSSDAEFLRRASLDIAGRIPLVSETRQFLKDDSPDKRRKAVERLLASPTYVTNFANVWTKALIPEATADPQLAFLLPSFDAWVRKQLADDVRYDEMVHEILTMPLSQQQITESLQRQGDPTPLAFYQAKQVKAENLASAASRMFLGVRIDCAQCHDHPMDKWTQDDFWGFAAFFAGVQPRGDAANAFNLQLDVDESRRSLPIPDTDKVVEASYLGGGVPIWSDGLGSREALAAWVTAPRNPYFSKMAVNRVWGHLFGSGLVEPVDDFSEENPPLFPELLELLANQLVDNQFDVKSIIRSITATKAYQLTSRMSHESQDQPEMFSRMQPKGLTPEQLFDSVASATGFYQPFNLQNRAFVMQNPDARTLFLEQFNNQEESVIERETTILQALSMMNGSFIADATDPAQSRTLAAVVDFPLMSTSDRVETLFLAALCRKPTKAESEGLTKYVDSGGPKKDSKQAIADVFWALLNSSEFLFNH